MRLPDSSSFRQRPTGLSRWFLHTPVWLYRAHQGFLLGHRFLLITHVGRTSGREYQTFLGEKRASEVFHAYELAHPSTAQRLLDSMGNSYDGTHTGREAMMAGMPMIAFTDPATD